MYSGMYDEKGRISKLNLDNPRRETFIQSGIWEKYILCFRCENEFLSGLEALLLKPVRLKLDVTFLKM